MKRYLHHWSTLLVLALFNIVQLDSVYADVLTLDKVLDSAKTHTPLIMEAQANQRIARADELSAAGVFDLTATQENYGRFTGFWDGRITDTQLTKRYPAFNSRVYASYRISSGEFPIYEDILFTNSFGELKVGVIFSLLQDRDFDRDRFRLLSTRLATDRAGLDAQLTKVQVQFQAMTIFKEWLAAGMALNAYQQLLNLAQSRQQGFERRVAEGDLASIFLNENQQNILKRETLTNEAERVFQNAGNRLSFYYRDTHGQPLTADADQLPGTFPQRNELILTDLNGDILNALANRPEVRMLDNERQLAQAELRQGENLRKPKLDLSIETSRDFGNGSITREGTDVIVAMNFRLPFARTEARGRISAAQAKLDRLTFKQQRVNEQLQIEINNIANDIQAARDYVRITAAEVEQARIMENAERKRFDNGASDFFLLNIREENSADAEVRHIQAEAQYFIAVAAYYAATLQIEKLGLSS